MKPRARFLKNKQNGQTIGSTNKKGENTRIKKIRDEKGDAITDATDIKRTVRNNHKQLYANNLENLEEVGRLQDVRNLPN